MIVLTKQKISFSPQALYEQKLDRLAGDAVTAAAGAIVGWGDLPPARACYLANLGVAYHREFFLSGGSAAAAGTAQTLLGALQEKGYSCLCLGLEQKAAGPEAISLLIFRESRLARVVEVLKRHSPRLAGGSAAVVEGLGEEGRGLVEYLGSLGIEATEEATGAGQPSFIWWVAAPAGGDSRAGAGGSFPGAAESRG